MIRIPFVHTLALSVVLASGSVLSASGQPAPPKPAAATPAAEAPSKACPDCAARRKDYDGLPTQTFYIKYANSPNDMNEIASALRQLLPDARTFILPSQAAIIVRGITEDIALAQKTINDLDLPKKTWRLTYTIAEMDGDKRIGTQHYSMDIVDGQQSTLKQGSRVPIATGSSQGAGGVQTTFTYQDIGMSFDATLDQQASGARLRSSIERTAIATLAANGTSDPVFRNSLLKGAYILAISKPLILGAMDIPDSTHHLQIEVLMEPLP